VALATGANFSGFKEYLSNLVDLGFPIAEISESGECVVTKHEKSAGVVNRMNVTAQLLFELQGQLYHNPDVVADLSDVVMDQVDEN
jgi:hypothetical protein